MNATAVPAPAGRTAGDRSLLRAVAVPAEHGGWGLTLEPVVLGLLIAPSWAGVLVGLAAFGGFLWRTPAKLVAVDVRRGRRLDRTGLALRVALVEAALVLAAVAGATALAGRRWWVAPAVALPLVAVEAWFDVRSRGRRLAPELCGAVGVAGAAAAVVIAGGGTGRAAVAAWLVLAARSLGAIPFVRAQIARARRGVTATSGSDVAQFVAVAVAAAAVVADRRALPGAVAVAALAVAQAVWSRRDPPAVRVLGMRQMGLGLALVAVTGLALT